MFIDHMKLIQFLCVLLNEDISGAKSALQGETVGVCSSYKWGGQSPYDLPAAHAQLW